MLGQNIAVHEHTGYRCSDPVITEIGIRQKMEAELMKLLRVLEEGKFERLGSSKTRGADVRVIAATNRDLTKMSARGQFRKDLFYRRWSE